MQVVFILVCVSLVLKTVYTAVAIQPPVEKPPEFACEEGCYIPELNRVLPYNVPYSPQDGKSCEQYLCGTDGYTEIYSCGAIGLGSGCVRIPGDLYKPYPDCCDDATCPPSPPPSDNTSCSNASSYAGATSTA